MSLLMRSFVIVLLSLASSSSGIAEELAIGYGHPTTLQGSAGARSPDAIKQDLAELLQRLQTLHPHPAYATTLKVDKNAAYAASSALETHWGGQECVITIHEDLLEHLEGNEARMAFTLAHELSHCLRGDIVSRTQSPTLNPMLNWRQEYQADQSAARMLKKLGYDIDHGAEILNYLGRGCSKTHPPTAARLRALMTGQQMGYRECLAADTNATMLVSHLDVH
jgi:Zn-dependent protease with chaperone function